MSICNRQHERRSTNTIVAGSALFLQALRDDSNVEADWLWLANQAISDRERIYSLRRALFINPASSLAERALVRLTATSTCSSPTTRPCADAPNI